MTDTPTRIRRPPPPFRQAVVAARDLLTPRMMRVTLAGDDLRGLTLVEPAASVRVLLPTDGVLVVPTWTGNEFVRPDGSRPIIRTLTPVAGRRDGELDLHLVLHGDGAAASWAQTAAVGSPAAVSGPARGHDVDGNATGWVVAGDETALPAMAQLVAALPRATPVRVHVEIGDDRASTYPLTIRDGARVDWHRAAPGDPPGTALLAAVEAETIDAGTVVWAAGEAAGVQRIRRHLFEVRGLPRSRATVRGYWKVGRAAGGE